MKTIAIISSIILITLGVYTALIITLNKYRKINFINSSDNKVTFGYEIDCSGKQKETFQALTWPHSKKTNRFLLECEGGITFFVQDGNNKDQNGFYTTPNLDFSFFGSPTYIVRYDGRRLIATGPK
ncbi:hypothetical protein LH464_24065 [Neorhizobium sp. T786]|uniref:hypothetical protein n=1 Tax=Pseudorhizobium xiangyangii TaxID=2883104 RepID=UPI001CFF6191|nr:hypothetical protein [Neorhizobium xiangyangii]MCB5205518.1 hypothetical protein [Neorhizobium xiangyangii]